MSYEPIPTFVVQRMVEWANRDGMLGKRITRMEWIPPQSGSSDPGGTIYTEYDYDVTGSSSL